MEEPGRFKRVKGNLIKFRYVEILDDPSAAIEREVTLKHDAVHDRPEDGDLIYASLAALMASESVAEFYGKQIQDSKNQIHSISRCVERVGEILQKEEQRFREYLAKVMRAISEDRVPTEELADRHRGTLEVANAWWISLGERVQQSEANYTDLIRRSYMFSSYVLHRAVDYVARNTDKIDPNDYEDARYCLHLGLESQMTAVTDDRLLRHIMQDALSVVNSLQEPSWHTEVKVCDAEGFKRQLKNL